MRNATPAFVVISAFAVACAAVEPTGFPFIKDVTPPGVQTGEVAAFTLDTEVFDKLNDNTSNLRLFDDAGREQPSLIRPRVPVQTITYERSFASPVPADSFRQLPDNRIEIVVTRDSRQPPPCGLRLESGISNFEKLVTVSASNDGQNWSTLVSDVPIYDYSRFVNIRKDTIRFQPANFTKFRLEISNIIEKKDSPLVEIIRQTRGAGNAYNEVEATSFRKEPFRIERLVFVERVTETNRQGTPETVEILLSGWTVTNDVKKRETVIEFATRRQPLTALTVSTDDLNFSRGVYVEGTDAPDRKTWRFIGSGRISRIRAGVIRQDNLVVRFGDGESRSRFHGESRCRFYRLVIANQDNPPLKVTHLAATERRYETLFFPKAGIKYRIAYGGAEVSNSASYDIGTVLAACPVESAAQWSLGPELKNPLFKSLGPKAIANGKTVLIVSIVAMVLVLAFLIAGLVRKVGLEPRD